MAVKVSVGLFGLRNNNLCAVFHVTLNVKAKQFRRYIYYFFITKL